MSESETDTLIDDLCTECGLCCNGVLFTSVICSTAAEVRHMEALGTKIEMKEGLGAFAQPCPHLSGTRCSVYTERPTRCRNFECELLKAVRRGEQSVDDARTIIAETREAATALTWQLNGLDGGRTSRPLAHRCDEVMDHPTDKTEEWWQTYAEFNLQLRRVQALLRAYFYEAKLCESDEAVPGNATNHGGGG